MPLSLDLNKAAAGLRLNLEKKGVATPPPAELAFVLDVSGSFDDEHRDGSTQQLLERLVPWGMVFDPDQKLDVFTFSNGPEHAHHVGDISPATTENFIRRSIIERVPGWGGGTDYSYVLEKALQNFGWIAKEPEQSGGGFFGRLFGSKKPAAPAAPTQKRRSIVLFVTDGANSDETRTREVLRTSQQRGDQVYFLFIAISNQGNSFPFLKRIGDEFNNTGLTVITDLRRFVRASDDEVNSQLIGDELVAWLKA